MNKLYLGILICLVAVAVVGGLLVAGGPGYARMEKEDRARGDHLHELGRYYACTVDGQERVQKGCSGMAQMPAAPAPTQEAEYLFARTGETAFEVCTSFKTDWAKSSGDYGSDIYFDGQRGCIRYKRAALDGDWVPQ
jgi:hypothetical protein